MSSSGCGSGTGRRCSNDGRRRAPYSKNGGDRRPRFWRDAAAYRFLPPFFFPPLALFFAIALYPPLHHGIVREEPRPQCHAAACRHAGGGAAAPLASLPTPARRAREVRIKKIGGAQVALTPPGPVGGG